MKSLAAVVLALSFAAPVARAQRGRARAGYDVENAPARQPPSLAQPTREEILEAQRRGRIRDRAEPDWIRGRELTELDLPNPFQVQEVLKNPYRHRQDDLKP